ncbi:MAG: YafY family transcriptional regulator [Lachnospiraceae bacterium]|nr:YafY family transcriptional regulator [Lachnospiraceae bacterium]
MKIDRLIGILSILLQKDTVTAPELAEHFEVSRRTINRDIDDLCKAGIPIYTRQGQGGGISIVDDYKMDRTLFTNGELQDILAGLRSLDSVNGTNRYGQLMEKISAGSSDFMTGNQSILINLSSWYKDSLASKIELIRNAIDMGIELEFLYFSPKGENRRIIEPYYLIFQWASWYVWGWCTDKADYRLFKLNRMEQVELSANRFEKRNAPMPDLSDEKVFPSEMKVKAIFHAECKWRLVEEYGSNCFTVTEDGKLLYQGDYTNKEYLISWLLSFGEKVELIEPLEIRNEISNRIDKMKKNYEKNKKDKKDKKNKKSKREKV